MCILLINPAYAFSPLNNTYNTTEDIYKIKVIKISCSSDILTTIKDQSAKHNMDWKIIYCVVGYESGFKADKIYITTKEKSYGLLQINIISNFPKDKNPNPLLDSVYNLNYQLNNLNEVYKSGVNLGFNGVELAEYVMKNGQRADWHNKANIKYIKDSIKEYYNEAILIES